MPELNKLDFVSGIKAEKINENFNTVDTWIKNERRRVGGYGLVEGFDLSADVNNFTVTIGAGIFINQAGEEKEIAEKVFFCEMPNECRVEDVAEPLAEGIVHRKLLFHIFHRNVSVLLLHCQLNRLGLP